MKALPAVAVLGLGAMGHAFAANLLKKGFTVYGWNRTPGRGEDLEHAGLQLCNDPALAVADAQVVIAMLTDGDATQSLIRAVAPSCQQGATFCQMGTIGIQETANAVAQLHALRPDMLYLDAPVSGTKAPAENAQILVMASGDRTRAEAAQMSPYPHGPDLSTKLVNYRAGSTRSRTYLGRPVEAGSLPVAEAAAAAGPRAAGAAMSMGR